MADLHDVLNDIAAEPSFSGVVRVDVDDRTETRCNGLAHRGLGIPNEANTQFAVASGGKGFTALAVVSLIADGVLSLDVTARSILGEDLPLIADDVTVEHLLTHTAGIGDYLDEDDETIGSTDYVLKYPVHRLTDAEAFVSEVDGYPTQFPAGERFSYCNGGYIVLALITERVTGQSYHEIVQERVIEPAGLHDTGFLRSDEPAAGVALGYLYDEGLRTNVLHLPVVGNGDGGIYTTAANMHMFWRSFTGGRIVPADWFLRMTEPRSDVPRQNARYGIGFWLSESGPAVRLVGSDAGVSFYSSHDPDAGATWTVISNTTDGAWPAARLLDAMLW